MNGSGGAALGKDLRLNDQTMVEHRGKYFVLRRDEPSGGWLELSLIVVDVSTLEVTNGKIELLKYGLPSLRRPNEQTITSSLINDAYCKDSKIELSSNPVDPRTWLLLIQGSYERRIFIHQQVQASLPESFKFY